MSSPHPNLSLQTGMIVAADQSDNLDQGHPLLEYRSHRAHPTNSLKRLSQLSLIFNRKVEIYPFLIEMRELKVQIILILRFLVGLLSKFTSRGNELVPMFNKMILAHFPFIFFNNYMDF